MSRRNGDNRPHMRPVTRIELSEQNIKTRWILIAVFLSIAAVAIGMGFYYALQVQPGWNAITVSSNAPNCGVEFKLMYDFTDYGGDATAVNKQLQTLYSDAAVDGHLLFSTDMESPSKDNLQAVNEKVNQSVRVDRFLYNAFQLLEQHGNRNLYLAPVYVEYNRIFNSESDVNAAEYDPRHNPEVTQYLRELTRYTNSPEHISLELVGEEQVILHVSENYLAYAKENGIDNFLDFGWMKNAFLVDYIANILTEAGFTNGYLVSYDGFTRNLDRRGQTYSFNLFDMVENTVYMPGQMQYSKPMSIVSLRSYPMDELDQWSYYAYANGDITTSHIDPADGVNKYTAANLVAYSEEHTCAEILMDIIPTFVADSLDYSVMKQAAGNEIYCIWSEGTTLCYNEESLQLTLVENENGLMYQEKYIS